MAFYEQIPKFTNHAIQRYIERSISKGNDKLTNFQAQIEMTKWIEESIRKEVSPNEWHYEIPYEKMIFVIVDNVVVTFTWK